MLARVGRFRTRSAVLHSDRRNRFFRPGLRFSARSRAKQRSKALGARAVGHAQGLLCCAKPPIRFDLHCCTRSGWAERSDGPRRSSPLPLTLAGQCRLRPHGGFAEQRSLVVVPNSTCRAERSLCGRACLTAAQRREFKHVHPFQPERLRAPAEGRRGHRAEVLLVSFGTTAKRNSLDSEARAKRLPDYVAFSAIDRGAA